MIMILLHDFEPSRFFLDVTIFRHYHTIPALSAKEPLWLGKNDQV